MVNTNRTAFDLFICCTLYHLLILSFIKMRMLSFWKKLTWFSHCKCNHQSACYGIAIHKTTIQPPLLTPANQDVPPEVFPLWDESEGQQGLQVHALHQQPEVIGQDAELEESHSWLARCLETTQQHTVTSSRICHSIYQTMYRWK